MWDLIFPLNITKNLNYKIGSYGHLNSRVKDLITYGDVDILFLGSSHAYRGFDPRVFKKYGIKSFNLGSSNQTPIQTEILLKRYLNSLNPKIVVFEAFPGVFSSDGVESAMDLIANDKIDYQTIKMALDLNHVKVYNTLICGMIRDLLNLDSDFVEPERIQKWKDTYIKGGFVEKEISFFENNEVYSLKKWDLVKYQKDAFERIIKKLTKLKINVILVQAPITKERHNSYSNNSEIDSYFKSLADYYNFNDILNLPSTTYFSDSDHLNQYGVEIFNKSFIDILKNNNYL